MIDQGVPYTVTTPLGSFTLNPNGWQGDGVFLSDAPDAESSSEADVSGRGFGDGSIFGRTRLPGLRYGLAAMVAAPDPSNRETLEDGLRGHITSLRGDDGSVSWLSKKDGTLRIMRGVRAIRVPRPAGDRVGVNKIYEFEIACPRPYVEGELVTVESTGLDLTGGGQVFPSALPWSFNSSGGGLLTCPNPGNTDERPVFRITGPVTAPELVRIDTQDRIVLEGLILASGDYVDIDMFERSIIMNGTTSVRGTMRPRVSSFFSIPPGGAQVRLVGSSFTSETKITAYARGAFAA